METRGPFEACRWAVHLVPCIWYSQRIYPQKGVTAYSLWLRLARLLHFPHVGDATPTALPLAPLLPCIHSPRPWYPPGVSGHPWPRVWPGTTTTLGITTAADVPRLGLPSKKPGGCPTPPRARAQPSSSPITATIGSRSYCILPRLLP